MYSGFLLSQKSDLTSFMFSSLPPQSARMNFIIQYNAFVSEYLRIDRFDANKTLHDIFRAKIDELIGSEYASNEDENIISLYKNGDYEGLKRVKFAIDSKNLAVKFIQMIYVKEEQGLVFSSARLFENYVYEKISKRHPDKRVTFKQGLILVQKGGRNIIGVMPSFKHICKNSSHKASDEIRMAYHFASKNDIENVFIVFPKNRDFTKHIVVKNACANDIKLVPYSISSRLFYNKLEQKGQKCQ